MRLYFRRYLQLFFAVADEPRKVRLRWLRLGKSGQYAQSTLEGQAQPPQGTMSTSLRLRLTGSKNTSAARRPPSPALPPLAPRSPLPPTR